MMIKKKKDTGFTDLFMTNFVGEYVEMLCNFYERHAFQNEEGAADDTFPSVVNGYILDMDDEYYYMGNTPEFVHKAIKKSQVRYIEVVQEQSVYDKILDDMHTPNRKEEEN